MNRMELGSKLFIGMMIPGALWVSVSMPQYWRLADGRPAVAGNLLSPYGSSQQVVSPLTRVDQAQGRGR